MELGEGKRVFLEVRDPRVLVEDLRSQQGLFVPTRLPLSLNTVFLLALRLRNVRRFIELPMVVLGRRVPRGGSMLSAGVVARVADPKSAMFELLQEFAAGTVVDLESRIQERHRIAARARFATTEEAVVELRALLNGPAQFPVDELALRGDRLALVVFSDQHGALLTPHVIVRSMSTVDGNRSAAVELLDDNARALVVEWLTREGEEVDATVPSKLPSTSNARG